MAPRDNDSAPVMNLPKNVTLKSVDKAMEIPFINDAIKITRAEASPIMDKGRPLCEQLGDSVVGELSSAAAVKLNSVTQPFKTSVETLDNLASQGIEMITEATPILQQPSAEVIDYSREVAESYGNIFKEYVASFAITQVFLRLTETGLSAVDSVLESTGLDSSIPLASTVVKRARRTARATRRAGMRQREPKPAATLSEASIVGAVLEVLGINTLLACLGLVLVAAQKKDDAPVYKSPMKTKEVDDDEDLPVRVRLSPEKLESYESEEDPDYAPSEAGSEDSLEYNSEADEVHDQDDADITYEDEHAKVINSEDNEEDEPVIVDTAISGSEDDEVEVESDLEEPERVGVADVSECNTPQCEKPAHSDLV